MTAATALVPATRDALAVLLLAMADDELVLGFSDSEWTGIAPLEEDGDELVGPDELGHAQSCTACSPNSSTTAGCGRHRLHRPAEGHHHARLLDHRAATGLRPALPYDTADAVRLRRSRTRRTSRPGPVGKIRREERYHAPRRGLARAARPGDVESRERLLGAMGRLGPDAWTVLTPLPNDLSLVMAGVLDASLSELDERWRAAISPTLDRLGLAAPGPAGVPGTARTGHSDAFRWLHGELSSVRRLDPEATW
jgi:ring-1,2-phenylacetyl-CoA epoxidase subunit PaaC